MSRGVRWTDRDENQQGDEGRYNLITLFRLSAQDMVDELVARMVEAGYEDIRPAHSRVFEALEPEGSRISDLAERAQMTHQSMSQLVAGLEAQGYVERQPDPNDRRAKLICLTARGRTLMQLALEEISRIETEWLSRLRMHGVDGDLLVALEKKLPR